MQSLNREINEAVLFLLRHDFKVKLGNGYIVVAKLLDSTKPPTPNNGAYRLVSNDDSLTRSEVAKELKRAAEDIKRELVEMGKRNAKERMDILTRGSLN